MKAGRFVTLVVALFVWCACSKTDNNPPLVTIASIDALRSAMRVASADSALIVSIDSTSHAGVVTITYDDGSILQAAADFLSGIQIDKDLWQASISFSDNTSLQTPAAGNLNIDDSMITLNPFGNAPLAAIVKVRTPYKGTFIVTVHKKTNGVDVSHLFQTMTSYAQLQVLGLYDNYANQVEVRFLSRFGIQRTSQTLTITTAPVAIKPAVTINTNALSPTDASIFMGVNSGPWGFDQKGDVRYYYTGDLSYIYGKLRNGNLIISGADGSVSYYSNYFYEVSMVGEIIKKYTVANFQHHDIREMPNGNFLVGTNSTPIDLDAQTPNQDMVQEIDRVTGLSVKTFNLTTILDPTRAALPDSNVPADWFHLNSVYYNAADNSLVVSGRSQSAVVKLDYQTGQIKWILADPHGWNSTLSPFLLTPVSSSGAPLNTDTLDFWPYGQHHVWQLQNGNVLMMDDGDYRNYYADNKSPATSYTRGAEYAIDPLKKTIQLVWTYDHGKNLFCQFTGSIEQLATGNRMIGYMDGLGLTAGVPKILILDSQSNPVFEAVFNPGQEYYRALKFNLYDGIN